jgi:hypothetical protein
MNIRVYDVLISGPLWLYLGSLVDEPWLQLFVYVVGGGTIFYNAHNLCCLETPQIPMVHQKHGKTQVHRLYNVLIMYPLLWYANERTRNKKLKWVTFMYSILIIVGLVYNTTNWIKLREEMGVI